jgi:large conductance mechanosensitive channel
MEQTMFQLSKSFIFSGGFLARVSLFELAVGWVLLGVIGRLITSLIEDIVMPVIGRITGDIDFSNLFIPLNRLVISTELEQAQQQGPVFAYGNFLTILLNAILVAAIILPFMFWIRKKFGQSTESEQEVR